MNSLENILKENELLRKELAETKELTEKYEKQIATAKEMNDLLKITQDILLDRAGFDKTGKPRLLNVPYGRLPKDKRSGECLVVAFTSNRN